MKLFTKLTNLKLSIISAVDNSNLRTKINYTYKVQDYFPKFNEFEFEKEIIDEKKNIKDIKNKICVDLSFINFKKR